MQPKISFTCTEHWENMRVGVIGRHCFQCDKVVVDFMDKTKVELVQYMLDHQDGSICGRVRRDQIDVFHELFEVCVLRSLRTNRTSNLAFYIMAVGGVVLAGCDAPMNVDNGTATSIDTTTTVDTLNTRSTAERENSTSPQQERSSSEQVEIPLVGALVLDEGSQPGPDHVERLPDIMPEFPGGQDSLFAFIRERLTYPKWEADNNIGGKVYVEFFVEKDGVISEPCILRSVKEARNFDEEVLRVMKLMPHWTPGKNGEEVVRTRLVLPFNFVQ